MASVALAAGENDHDGFRLPLTVAGEIDRSEEQQLPTMRQFFLF